MDKYEMLLEEADSENINVIENYHFNSDRIKGLYCNGFVAISKKLRTNAEKNSIITEELGHHFTTIGNIIDQSSTANRKQERRARLWAYNKMIGLSGIVNAYNKRYSNISDIADYLNVTEEFFLEAIECYKSKYGTYAKLDNYVIYFEPLGVLELYK